MPKTKQEKEQLIQKAADLIKDAKAVIIANQEGLTVNDSQVLRRKCQEQKVAFMAVKKTLFRKALEQIGIKDMDVTDMPGSLAIAVSREDEVAPAKVLKDFAKKHEQVVFNGGLLAGLPVTVEVVKKLADLPSKIELLAKVVGSIKAPVSGFVTVLKGNLRGLVCALNAIKNTK